MAGFRWLGGLLAPLWKRKPHTITADNMSSTRFFGSQLGGKSVINYSYTDMPWKLLAADLYTFFTFSWAIPYILFPITPSDSGELDELALTGPNIWAIVVHFVLCIIQILFFLALPFTVIFPIWMVVAALVVFMLINYCLSALLNGKDTEYHSDPKYAPEMPEHAHEQWIFINGVAVGEHWMKNNLNRLALTFRRPILGIHNKTNGIFFDVVECLVQRSFGYATFDVRTCYRIIKEKLYNPQYSKVIFILHSQGGIEGSLILDWLLQELPQDLLSKLEVYTFGNAANHFNNPHRHVESQAEAFKDPLMGGTDSTRAADQITANSHANGHADGGAASAQPGDLTQSAPFPVSDKPADPKPIQLQNSQFSMLSETSASQPSNISDRAIGHIEHYAHTTDFVALWGVLHFATAAPQSQSMPRFIGRVFARSSPRGGHQFCQHYLDGMFPLARDADTGQFVGCADNNEFMESKVSVGAAGDEFESVREAMQISWLGPGNRSEAPPDVEVHNGGSPVDQRGRVRTRTTNGKPIAAAAEVKVKDLSRLWQYRNGRSPNNQPSLLHRDADGVVRGATM